MPAFDLPLFLESQFPGLALPLVVEQPLFYRWPIALRFELCAHGRMGLDPAVSRAAELYEAAFRRDEVVVVIGAHRRWPSIPAVVGRDRGSLFEINDAAGFGIAAAPERFEAAKSSTDSDEGPTVIVEWSCQPAGTFDYRRVFEAIANADFARRPAITGDVYLLSPGQALLFWMYDDRGIDAAAASRGTLQPLYDRFEPWLLQHDRERMDRVFRGTK